MLLHYAAYRFISRRRCFRHFRDAASFYAAISLMMPAIRQLTLMPLFCATLRVTPPSDDAAEAGSEEQAAYFLPRRHSRH